MGTVSGPAGCFTNSFGFIVLMCDNFALNMHRPAFEVCQKSVAEGSTTDCGCRLANLGQRAGKGPSTFSDNATV